VLLRSVWDIDYFWLNNSGGFDNITVMAEPKIEDISSRFDEILQLTGENSYVNWETFTKSSTQFTKTLE